MSPADAVLRLVPRTGAVGHQFRRAAVPGRSLLRVCEGSPANRQFVYEDEGSERLTRGAVTLPDGAWWTAELSVAIGDGGATLLRLARHGATPEGFGDDPATEVLIPTAEAGALVSLLVGVVEHALRDGVLPAGRAS